MDEKRKRMPAILMGCFIASVAFVLTVLIGGLIGSVVGFQIRGGRIHEPFAFVYAAVLSLFAAVPISIIAGGMAATLFHKLSNRDSD